MPDTVSNNRDYTKFMLVLLGAALLFRWAIVFASPLGLHGDEAQYWAWSRDLDWGYFTKPPLIAWVIAISTSIFGHAEWAIRLPSAFIHSLTAWVIFTTAWRVFDVRTGFWAGCTYLFMPAVWLSSTIISTDVPLLFCWALALNAWVALRERPSWHRALQLGLAVGFGLLAKYAMLFFLPILGLALLFDKPTRFALFGPKGLLTGLIIAVLFTPNIIWNLNHNFATLSHTAENANLKGQLFNLDELLTFWIDQLGVFGPLSFPILIIALLKFRSLPSFGKWVAALAILPLSVISLEAFLSRANANWAVTTYVASALIVAVFAVSRPKVLHALKYGLIGQSALMIVAGCIILSPALTDASGLSNSVKRLRAWPETISIMEARFSAGHEGRPFEAIVTDKRLIFYNKTYYGLSDTAPLHMWMLSANPSNHAELTSPLPATEGPVLLINYHEGYEPFLREDFQRLVPLSPIEIDLGGGKMRRLKTWAAYGYTPTRKERTFRPQDD